jgi:hypothetical protein
MHQIDQQAHGDKSGNVNGIHHLPPNFSQPAAKAHVNAKKSTIAPM